MQDAVDFSSHFNLELDEMDPFDDSDESGPSTDAAIELQRAASDLQRSASTVSDETGSENTPGHPIHDQSNIPGVVESDFSDMSDDLYDTMVVMDAAGDDLHTDALNETMEFVNSKRNANTVRKTKSDIKVLHAHMRATGDQRMLENIPPEELNMILAKYYMTATKNDGTDYETTTMFSFRGSVHRYLTEKDYPCNTMSHPKFKHANDVLHAKVKDLKEKGMGNRKNRSEAYTPHEIECLWDSNLLGAANPTSLLNSMWFNNTYYFGMRGRAEHVSLLWGDITLKRMTDGTEYLEYTERTTKTRNGNSNPPRQFPPKMFEQKNNPRCPVSLYKAYSAQRPAHAMTPESRFYLQINRVPNPVTWFKHQPLGKDSIGNINKRMATSAGIQGKKTNHGVRRTSIQTLTHAKVPPNQVMQVSGHHNIGSINEYGDLSVEQQREISDTLFNAQMPSTSSRSMPSTSSHIMPSTSLHQIPSTSSRSLVPVSSNTGPSVDSDDEMPTLRHVDEDDARDVISRRDLPVRMSRDSVVVDQMPFAINFSGSNVKYVKIYNKSS